MPVVVNIGSVNVDEVLTVPRIAKRGETLSASSYARNAGGKGANQSISVAATGATCIHIGRVGKDGVWVKDMLEERGVQVKDTLIVDDKQPTGRAIIQVSQEQDHDNCIVLLAGANASLNVTEDVVPVLDNLPKNERHILLLQNEVNNVKEIINAGHSGGMFIVYNAAPMTPNVADDNLNLVDMLVLNENETIDLSRHLGIEENKSCASTHPDFSDAMAYLGIHLVDKIAWEKTAVYLIITLGPHGALLIHKSELSSNFSNIHFPALPLKPSEIVDTTGAGDCFVGFLTGYLAMHKEFLGATQSSTVPSLNAVMEAINLAIVASGLKCKRAGAMNIPSIEEFQQFVAANRKTSK